LAGKSRSARNAFRHGLAAKIVRDGTRRQEADALTRLFAEQTDLAAARALADAEAELQRVCAYRTRLLAALPTPDEAASSAQGEAISKIIAQLEKTLPYERRALARRNKAIQQAQRARSLP
jgi:hypothetical protein